MARIVICDRCGKDTKGELERARIFKHKCKWSELDVEPLVGEYTKLFLCSDCVKELKKWMEAGKHAKEAVHGLQL